MTGTNMWAFDSETIMNHQLAADDSEKRRACPTT